MARRVARSDGVVRQALTAEAERAHKVWGVPGVPSERLEALRSGVPVLVSGQQLLCASDRAGLPWQQFAYGGVYRDATFLLDENDQLHEVDV